MPLRRDLVATRGVSGTPKPAPHAISQAIRIRGLILQAIRSVLRTLRAYVRLVRLSNSLAASALVVVGAHLVTPRSTSFLQLLSTPAGQAALAMWCVTAFGYVSNDLYDVAEDAINKPGRPLPQGVISRPAATGFAALLALGALLCSWPLGPLATTAALLVMALLTLYNSHLKSTSGGGNLLIGGLAGCALLAGGVAVLGPTAEAIRPLLAPAAMIAAFVTTREMLKTVEDVAGDRAVGKQTVTTRWGIRGAAQIISALALATGALAVLPFWYADYSLAYFLWITGGVSLPLLYTAVRLQYSPMAGVATHCLALLKASYVAGVVALWLA